MKARVAELGSFVAAVTAVVGSVSLSLLAVHPPSDRLLPWTAPADRGHVSALVLPAPPVWRTPTGAHVEHPLVAAVGVALAPAHETPRPAAHTPAPARDRRPSPPSTQPTPTPVAKPVTTPPVASTAITTNNGRWSTAAKVTSWKAGAAKQATRAVKGKPSWAGPKHIVPTVTVAVTTQIVASAATKISPGQPKTKTPPGQAKKTR